MRGLRPWAEDKAILTAIGHGEFLISGFRNRDLRPILYGQTESIQERKKCAALITRKLRLLRAHGFIKKVPNTHRNHVTKIGGAVLIAVPTV